MIDRFTNKTNLFSPRVNPGPQSQEFLNKVKEGSEVKDSRESGFRSSNFKQIMKETKNQVKVEVEDLITNKLWISA